MVIASVIISAILAFGQQAEPTECHEYIGDITISAYSVYEGGGENETTASGATPTAYHTIATSDKYPFGTRLYIEGIGECVVEDRGGYYIQSGRRIDLFIGEDDPNQFGLQNRRVYLIKQERSN